MARLERFLLELGHGSRSSAASITSRSTVKIFTSTYCLRLDPGPFRGGRTEGSAGFEPEYVGKLGCYVSWIDENLSDRTQHAPTIGILLCAGRNDNVVRTPLPGPPHRWPSPTTPTPPPRPH
jgi:hypothetical protein